MKHLPPLDFTPIKESGKHCIVRVDTEEHAQHLVDEMWRQYPRNAFGSGYKGSYWGRYDDLCYNIYLSGYGDTMTVSPWDDYRKSSGYYCFFEYSDLVCEEEITEFTSAEFEALLI